MHLSEIICPKCHSSYYIEGKIFNSSMHCTECQMVFKTPSYVLQRWSGITQTKNRTLSIKIWILLSTILVTGYIFRWQALNFLPGWTKYFLYYDTNTAILKNYVNFVFKNGSLTFFNYSQHVLKLTNVSINQQPHKEIILGPSEKYTDNIGEVLEKCDFSVEIITREIV